MEEKGMKKKKKLLRLFIETFYLSAFTFGGGYDRIFDEEEVCE
jgi:chromate transporter